MTMSMIEYNTLNYIMYKEAMAKLEQQEKERQAARDDEIKKQRAYGSEQKPISVLTEQEKKLVAAHERLNNSPGLDISESDLEELLEEEGLI